MEICNIYIYIYIYIYRKEERKEAEVQEYAVENIYFLPKETIICRSELNPLMGSKGKDKDHIFKGADKIMKHLQWEIANKKEIAEYTVGYEDRFLGLLEIGIEDFMDAAIPMHRIMYFKRNKLLVWDRKRRINLLK